MCNGRGLNNKMKNLDNGPWGKFIETKKSSFKTILKRAKSTSINIRNMQYSATETF